MAVSENFEYDEDQQAVLDSWAAPELYLHAGPGSGKTTTVVGMAARVLSELPEARILVLVFNRKAEEVLQSRLRQKGAPLIYKKFVGDHEKRGVCVVTFDKFAYHAGAVLEAGDPFDNIYGDELDPPLIGAEPPPKESKPKPKAFHGGHRLGMSQSVAAAVGNPAYGGWTHLFLDEAQDIRAEHEAVVNAVLSESVAPMLFVAGDPRQEIQEGATWFSRRYAAAALECRRTLKYNHRSAPEIVAALNACSRAWFPTLHVD